MRIRYVFKELSNKRKRANDDIAKIKAEIKEINKRLDAIEEEMKRESNNK